MSEDLRLPNFLNGDLVMPFSIDQCSECGIDVVSSKENWPHIKAFVVTDPNKAAKRVAPWLACVEPRSVIYASGTKDVRECAAIPIGDINFESWGNPDTSRPRLVVDSLDGFGFITWTSDGRGTQHRVIDGWILDNRAQIRPAFITMFEEDLKLVIPAKAIPDDFQIPAGVTPRVIYHQKGYKKEKPYDFYRTSDLIAGTPDERLAAAEALVERSRALLPVEIELWPYVDDDEFKDSLEFQKLTAQGWVKRSALNASLGLSAQSDVDFSEFTESRNLGEKIGMVFKPFTLADLSKTGRMERFLKAAIPKNFEFFMRCVLNEDVQQMAFSRLFAGK